MLVISQTVLLVKPRKGLAILHVRMAVSMKIAIDFLKYFMRLTIYSFYCVCWLCISVLDSLKISFVLTNNRSPFKTAKLHVQFFHRRLTSQIYS